MRALLYSETFELDVTAVDVPVPRGGEVVVRVEAAGICGSDVHGMASRSPRRQPPLIMGHELVGQVVEVGEATDQAFLGGLVAINPQVPCRRCVLCRSGREHLCPKRELIGGTRAGGFAEFVSVPTLCVHPLTSVDPEIGVFAEPLATCIHALALARPPASGTAVVLGAGTIGVLAVQALRHIGVESLVLSDPDAHRRHEAETLASAVVEPDELPSTIHELTSGRGADLTIDAVGVESARWQSLEVLAPGGIALWLGMHTHDATVPAFDVVVREQRVQGSFAYTDPEFAAAVRLLDSGAIRPAVSYQSHDLDGGRDRFLSLVADEPQAVLKAIIRPHPARPPDYAGTRSATIAATS